MLQQGVVDGVDNRLVVLLRVFPRLLGTLQQQADDVGLNTLNQDKHGTGGVGVPLLDRPQRSYWQWQHLSDHLGMKPMAREEEQGKRAGALTGDVLPRPRALRLILASYAHSLKVVLFRSSLTKGTGMSNIDISGFC